MPKTFRPVRPFKEWPVFEAQPFDTRESVFIPDLSVRNQHIAEVSPTKIRLIGAKVYRSAQQSIADDAAWHSLSLPQTAFDQGGLVGADDTKLTIPYSGIWTISGFASYVANVTGLRMLRLLVNNGATASLRLNLGAVTGFTTDVFITSSFQLTAGDYIELQARQNSGGALAVDGGQENNFFSAMFMGSI